MITIVVGRRGVGKTTLAYFLSRKNPTRLIFDPRAQFKTSTDIVHDGVGIFELLDEKEEIIVQPYSDVKGNFLQVAQEFREWTIANPDEPCSFLVDEVRFLETPNENYDPLEQLLRFSDSSQVDIIFTCHRPGDIAVDIRAIADYLVFFRTTQEHDLKIIKERCGQEAVDVISNLNDYEFLVWNDGRAVFQVQKEPSIWYVDIRGGKVVSDRHGS
jgi:hypothetical protein